DIKLPKQIQIKLTIIEREIVLNELEKLNLLNFYEKRLFTIIYILLNTGIRAFELINLKWENFERNKILIKGKGNKFRYVYINEEFFKLINTKTKGYVIRSIKNKKISQKQLNLIVREFSKKIGLYFTPHDLRRSFCTHLIRNNCNIKIIQILMGHSNIAVTSRYICLTESEIFNAYNNIFN
ncbi:MAG: site-specific integrase, partial [Ureaplasma sp.]|nr:site-specific integrase [Ureaplasma sp.]